MEKCKMLMGAVPSEQAPPNLIERVKSSLEKRALLSHHSPRQNDRRGTKELFFRNLAAAAAMIALAGVLAGIVYTIVKPVRTQKTVAVSRVVENQPAGPAAVAINEQTIHPRFFGRLQLKTQTPTAVQAFLSFFSRARSGWHGVEFPYHSDLNIDGFYQQYCEALLAVDDSIGRVLDYLREQKLLDSTLIIYMGDNGFMFGEHGLIDKRVAYETSMRVPMLMHCPELFRGGTVVEKMVGNIDVAPTFLEAAGLRAPDSLDGRSLIALAQGKAVQWRDFFLYAYYWERNFPQTPTMHAIREDQYKFIRYYGIWDTDELYDIRNDPKETKNLINDPQFKALAAKMRKKLFDEMEKVGGMNIPLFPDRGGSQNLRIRKGSPAAEFPESMLRNKNGKE